MYYISVELYHPEAFGNQKIRTMMRSIPEQDVTYRIKPEPCFQIEMCKRWRSKLWEYPVY